MRGEIEIEIPFPKFPILSPPSGLQFQFQFVYSQPIRIEAEKGRTLNY